MNKLTTLLFLLLISLSSIAYAQKNDRNERIKMMKIGFITQQLDLTSKEAEKFWPIYNEHQKKMHSYKLEKKKLRKSNHRNIDVKTLSNAEAKKILDTIITLETKIHQQELKLYTDLKDILSASKLLILHKTENDFNRKILEKLRSERKRYR